MFSAATGLMSSIGSAALNYGKKFLGSSYGQAAIGAGAGLAGDFASGLVGHYFGKKSSKYSASQQRAMAKYMMKLQKEYNEWLIPFQNESNMEYQLRYANGRPQAEVSGLRAAGLNPILAAGGGFHSGSMSGASPSSIPSAPSPTYSPSSGKGARFYDPMLSRQLDLLDAEIEGQRIRNYNERENRGLDGKWGAISRLISEAQNRIPNSFDFLKNSPLFTVEKKGRVNIESLTDDERKALVLYSIMLDKGYNDVDARDEGGEEFWRHLENAWAKERRNIRSTRH